MKIPPALAAKATMEVLELLGEPPGRVLEVDFAGIHAVPLRLAGFEVDVLDPDPRARARAGAVVEAPAGRYDAVVAPTDTPLVGIDAARVIRIDGAGLVTLDELPPVE